MRSFILPLQLAIALLPVLIGAPSFAQEASRIARCVSIPNVDERVECLERRRAAPDLPAQNLNQIRQPQVGPSFDCRMAATSVERAICSDPALSEMDLRLGQQYEQTLRQRGSAGNQALVESERAWVQKRNTVCGGVAGTSVWSCVLEMTKERIAALSDMSNVALDRPAEVTPPVQSPSGSPVAATAAATPITRSAQAPVQQSSGTTSTPPAASDGPNPVLVVLFVIFAIIGAIAVFGSINRRERQLAEQRRLAAERERLVAKYGSEIAERILARQIWQGMTQEQLLESWGTAADKDIEIKKSKSKETWKYGQTGKNRFSNRVFIENGRVIGWKQ